MQINSFWAFVIAFIALLVASLIGGLIIWGIGSLVCYAFHIDYNFTYLMGYSINLLLAVICGIFKKE